MGIWISYFFHIINYSSVIIALLDVASRKNSPVHAMMLTFLIYCYLWSCSDLNVTE